VWSESLFYYLGKLIMGRLSQSGDNRITNFLRLAFLIITISLLSPSVRAQEHLPQSGATHLYLPITIKSDMVLVVDKVNIIQGVTLSSPYKVHIADRDTLVRVFVSSEGGSSKEGITAELCAFNTQGQDLGCIPPDNGHISIPSTEADLNSTLNYSLPDSWLKPGFSYHIELYMENLSSGSISNMRYPQAGTIPFDFVTVPTLDVAIIPIEYRPYPGNSVYLPRTDYHNYLTHMPIKLLPFPSINFHSQPFMIYQPGQVEHNLDNPLGWVNLIDQLKKYVDMGNTPGVQKHYGVVNSYDAHGCSSGCITGIAYLGGDFAAGWSGIGSGTPIASDTFAHELGHNFGRNHTKCAGNETNPDEGYPYPGGSIGQFGLDLSSGVLLPPDNHFDFMSYCNNRWTSDYTYWHIYKYVLNNLVAEAPSSSYEDALYISGTISDDNQVAFHPIYRQLASVSFASGGTHLLEVLGADGNVLMSQSFTPQLIMNVDDNRIASFGIFIPAVDALHGLRVVSEDQILGEILRTSPPEAYALTSELFVDELVIEGNIITWVKQVSWSKDIVYRIRLSQDYGVTWRVLGLDLPATELNLPADIDRLADGMWIEVQASDGLSTVSKRFVIDNQ
jgi:hypothetical protein